MKTTHPISQVFLPLLISAFAWNAFADRSVSISVPDGKLQLTNPGSTAVSYTVECYDKTSGSNIASGSFPASLAAKGAATFQSGGLCAGGAPPAKTLTQGPFFCAGSVTYSAAATLCGTGSHVCTIANVIASGANYNDFLAYYWIKPHASSSTWYNTWDNWSKSDNPQDASGGKKPNAPVSYNKGGSSYRCAETSSLGSAGAGLAGCYPYGTSSSTGTMCCPDNNGFASCKVTIHGTGVAAGRLQSPQFKGGASF
jgi:hypothetical protein